MAFKASFLLLLPVPFLDISLISRDCYLLDGSYVEASGAQPPPEFASAARPAFTDQR